MDMGMGMCMGMCTGNENAVREGCAQRMSDAAYRETC